MTQTTAARPASSRPLTAKQLNRNAWSGILFGAGLMAGVDEIIFHQMLGWHHFYDLSTPAVALFSDGLLHSAEIIAFVAATFMLIDILRSGEFTRPLFTAGLVTGLGAFQLFDGIIDHKVLRIHQIRYGVDILPYDLAWNALGLALLLAGGLMWRRSLARGLEQAPGA